MRRAGATALVAAFVGGLLSGAPAAQAAPPGDGASDTPDDEKAGRTDVPPVWPRPQALRARGADVPLGTEATLVSDGDADPYALAAVRGMLRDAGVRTVHEARPGDRLPEGGPVFRVGTEAAEGALRALRAPERDDLPSGGYRLAAGRAGGRATVALSGVGDDGLFHAAQTLRQLITDRREGAEDAEGAEGGTGGKVVPGVVIRDWPTTSVRGVTEGFYGQPWSQQERLDHLDFLGRTKQNRYLYAPGTDPYRQATRWRDPYPAAQRADFRELAQHAAHNHVVLGWAVSPGQGLCFSSAGDRKALLRKLDAMHALGVRAFQLQFDDVSYDEWHCDGDAEKYGTGPEAAAEAQAELTNAVAAHLKARHGGAGSPVPLSVLPTEFYQEGRTAYRKALSRALADGVEVAWTGVGVVPRTITGGELADVRGAFPGHPVVTMDNYPVNDYAPGRLFLGPYRGRQPAVATGSAAVLANAMAQPTASRIPLFTAADYAWNPRDYQPGESWKAAVDDLAGPDRRTRAAVHALAGNDASSILGGDESAYLRPAIRDFWTAYGDGTLGSAAAADDLRAAFRTMRHAPERVPAGLGREARPWLRQLALLGEAGERSVDMLAAQAAGDGGAAWAAQLDVRRLRDEAAKSSVTVGKGVLKEFVDRALKAGDDWTGVRKNAFGSERPHGGPTARPGSPLEAAVDGDTGSAYRAGAPPVTELPARGRGEIPAPPDGLTVGLPRARSLAAVTVLTGPAADGGATRADIEAHVPGEGWQRIGRLSESGSTEAAAHGLRADALRLRWSAGSDAPVVHEITPWYADTPDASLALSRDDTYASIGGGPAEVAVRLTAQRPVEVRGRLKAEAPEGFTVRAPSRVTVPRGGTAEVPLRVTAGPEVRPGTYEVPVSFGDERRTLTVRAFPAVGGPDLARSAEAASSGDETPDFPAPHVNDGKAHTRWSSPAEDGAWVQLELARPARVGEVRLHWQDAYAAGYRVQVSPDGRRWRTAATVRDGAGGRETVRMDAPADTRFVRVQGDKRATRFGYSLWSVEVYAVREEKREEKDVKKEPEKQEPGKQGQDGER
ncbi:hyaluronidase [Streptomyces armeniacus]|uniref:Hyaluronidase n=1 Tax=Streptomyces armeniacus TaxID=83291 RepID=A0A345Y117_9ACTN|nr:beta-N-acetylglucosaminidase domain-containing protein [Streptomyces armeniacus]AXK37583.1 hyaluronidase [Streptomyces armeniacus]